MKIQNIDCNHSYDKTVQNSNNFVSFKSLPIQNQPSVIKISKQINNLPLSQKIELVLKKLLGLYNVERKGTYRVNIPFLEPYNLIADDIFISKNCKVRGFYKAREEVDLSGYLPQNATIQAGTIARVQPEGFVDGRIKSGEMLFISGKMTETSKAIAGFIDIEKNGESAGVNIADKVLITGKLDQEGQVIADVVKALPGSKVYGKITLPEGFDEAKGA